MNKPDTRAYNLLMSLLDDSQKCDMIHYSCIEVENIKTQRKFRITMPPRFYQPTVYSTSKGKSLLYCLGPSDRSIPCYDQVATLYLICRYYTKVLYNRGNRYWNPQFSYYDLITNDGVEYYRFSNNSTVDLGWSYLLDE